MAEHNEHAISPLFYVAIWGALIALTGITVGVSFLDMQRFTIFTAMLIAGVKATLVILYFMHLRFGKSIYAFMILFVMGTYAIFVILTFADYSFR